MLVSFYVLFPVDIMLFGLHRTAIGPLPTLVSCTCDKSDFTLVNNEARSDIIEFEIVLRSQQLL
jgi:hypothetical protein